MKLGVIGARLGIMAVLAGTSTSVEAQDDELKNLQHYSADIGRDSLVQVMRGFSFALGVRCQYCHTGGNGTSLEGVAFENDDDPDKRKARYMLEMVETLNNSMLPMMADRDEPAYEIGCKTCHRGQPKPVLLTDVLRATLDEHGADSTVARYRALREEVVLSGMFDFGEWEVNVLGERLAREGRTQDAITIYELNYASYPTSMSIILALGGLYERAGDVESAIRYYERALELAPENARVTARLEALRGL